MAATWLAALADPAPARAVTLDMLDAELAPVMLASLLVFAAFSGVALVILRRRFAERERELGGELERARAEVDRVKQFLASEPQIVVVWDRAEAEPHVEGEFTLVSEAMNPRRILAFGGWLEPAVAARVEDAVAKLLTRGEGFADTVASLKGRHLELAGRAIGGNAVMRIRDVSGDRLERVRLQEKYNDARAKLAAYAKLFDALPHPAWARGRDGQLNWRNLAFARALDLGDGRKTEETTELFDRASLRESEEARAAAGLWRSRVHATVGGERRPFQAFEAAWEGGALGLAADLSEPEDLRAENERQSRGYKSLLDQLATAVAIFDRAKRLAFYNAAYRQLWALDAAFLDARPTDGELLDHLRGRRLLPEQVDFRAWKAQTLSTYQAMETVETVWHLPDGRALRVAASPNVEGGVTYLYDDATQSFALAAQLNALTRLQGETLDALKEAVVVFGADGRLRLANPAFARLWGVPQPRAADRPHFDEISAGCLPLVGDPATWERLRGATLGLSEQRQTVGARIERTDGAILDCSSLPLPDGGTLMTFYDVTDTINASRALAERNAALVSAEKLRDDFVKHVSYELREPLNTVNGFAELLVKSADGLNERQRRYAGNILGSSNAVLAIIDDILDLASVDVGALELQLEEVDVVEAMAAAAGGVQDRLREADIELRIVATDGVGKLKADGRRVRQVLFNLLSNAIRSSAPGQTVVLAAMRRSDAVVFKMSDRGGGMAPEALDKAFDGLEAESEGARGSGLGLSIVRALVELHGGRVTIDSAPGEGAVVTCAFPLEVVERPAQEAELR